MIFGPVPPAEALGGILAHSFRLASGARLVKGTRLEASHVARLVAEGVKEIVVCRLEAGDVPENEAAASLATHLAGPGTRASTPATGRSNLLASHAGLLAVDVEALHGRNAIHESITVSSLSPGRPVREGDLVATVKIIPFSVPAPALEECLRGEGGVVRIDPFKSHRTALIQTRVAGTSSRLLERSERVIRDRLARRGSTLAHSVVCDHTEVEVADALLDALDDGAELVLMLGASATVDRRDVIPSAISSAGGVVLHFGLPIDPGNLTLLATHEDTPLLGVPGCARTPRRNGFDAVLERVLTGTMPTSLELAGLGVGGLWKEGAGRPQPRRRGGRARPPTWRVAGLVLAAGQSRRMGPANKLLEEVEGEPLVRRVVRTALGADLAEVVVVVGHDSERVRASLAELPVRFVENDRWQEGMGTSVAEGVRSLQEGLDGVLIALGDMPWVSQTDLADLLDAFDPEAGTGICVPVGDRRRGNPVLWGRRYFERLASLEGDVGARVLMAEFADDLVEVEVGGRGVLMDVDTPEALHRARAHGFE